MLRWASGALQAEEHDLDSDTNEKRYDSSCVCELKI